MRAITARVTPANPVAYVRLDSFHGAALAVQAVIEGAGVATSVWSAADATANGMTLSNGGLTVAAGRRGHGRRFGIQSVSTTGKIVLNFYVTADAHALIFGFADQAFLLFLLILSGLCSVFGGIGSDGGGEFLVPVLSSRITLTSPAHAANDVWALAVDFVGQVFGSRSIMFG